MSLRDLFDEEPQTAGRPICSIQKMKQQMDDDDIAFVDEMLADPLVTHSRIARVLRKAGFHVAETTIGRHRRQDCHCESP